VSKSPNEMVDFSYQLCVVNESNLIGGPILESDFLHFKADKVLVLPENDNEEWRINIHFNGFSDDFNIISSLPSHNKEASHLGTLDNLKNSVFVGGTDLVQEVFHVGKHPIRVAHKKGFQALKQHLLTIQDIMTTQINFWNRFDFKNYLIILLEAPKGEDNINIGTHYYGAMTMQYPLEQKVSSKYYYWALAHELEHGHTPLQPDYYFQEKDFNILWYMEGFNDYYGLLHAYQSGTISFNEYIEVFNDFIKAYYALPINDVSNKIIVEKYPKDLNYRLLSQLRGHFFAKYLACHMNSNNQDSFDIFMKGFLSKHKPHMGQASYNEVIEKYFKQNLKSNLWHKYIEYIQDGTLFEFKDISFGPSVELVEAQVEVPTLCLDFLTLIEKKVIRNIDTQSNAYKAGLREGQEISHYQWSVFNPESRAIFWIKENEEIKTISFTTNKTVKTLPQFVIKDPNQV
jgi:predicted metalloprotease with PDZ domain